MRIVAVSLAAMLGLLVANVAIAGDCCADPGCCEPSCCAQSCRGKCCCKKDCRAACEGKTCQVVCTMKKVKKTVWVVECECFCPTLPGCCRDRCRDACGNGCGGGCCEDGCGRQCCRWAPSTPRRPIRRSASGPKEWRWRALSPCRLRWRQRTCWRVCERPPSAVCALGATPGSLPHSFAERLTSPPSPSWRLCGRLVPPRGGCASRRWWAGRLCCETWHSRTARRSSCSAP